MKQPQLGGWYMVLICVLGFVFGVLLLSGLYGVGMLCQLLLGV